MFALDYSSQAQIRDAHMTYTSSADDRQVPVVMVVDDATTQLRAVKLFLEPAYKVEAVPDGFDALASIQEVRPDVLLLDIMMPRLDGYHVCMTLRENPLFKNLPIVMMTAKDSPFDKVRGDMVGCDAYITKPFTKEALLDTVGKMLKA